MEDWSAVVSIHCDGTPMTAATQRSVASSVSAAGARNISELKRLYMATMFSRVSAEKESLLATRLDFLLFDPKTASLWKLSTTLREIKPEPFEAESYVKLLERVFRQGQHLETGFSLLPDPLTKETKVARVDVRMGTVGAKATLSAAVLHLTLCDDQCEASHQFLTMSAEHSVALMQATDLLNEAKKEITVLRALRDEAVKLKVESEEKLLMAFCKIDNAKKEKIREIAAEAQRLSQELQDLRANGVVLASGAIVADDGDDGEETDKGISPQREADQQLPKDPLSATAAPAMMHEALDDDNEELDGLGGGSAGSLHARSSSGVGKKRLRSSTDDLLELNM